MLYVKWMNVIGKITAIISVISLVGMAILTFADVLMRFLFHNPITGATEWVQCLWILLATAYGLTTMTNEHTKVTVVTEKLPKKVVRVINLIATLACAVFCGFMIYGTYDNVFYSKANHVVFWQSNIPEWIIMLIYTIALVILALSAIAIAIVEWKGYETADEALKAAAEAKEVVEE